MPRLLQPLWFILASMTDRKLARMVEYLREENRILRSKLPKCVTVTPRERGRLVKLGKRLGSAINELIPIVTPRSFARSVAGDRIPKRRRATRKPGRPRTETEIRELILRIAGKTGWGYARILGELKNLGVRTISKTTVATDMVAWANSVSMGGECTRPPARPPAPGLRGSPPCRPGRRRWRLRRRRRGASVLIRSRLNTKPRRDPRRGFSIRRTPAGRISS